MFLVTGKSSWPKTPQLKNEVKSLGSMFTPVESAIGGMMIGLSAALCYMVDGKIAGIAGVLGPFLRGVTQCQQMSGGHLWKLLFLLGLVLGGLIAMIFNEDFSFPGAAPFHMARYIAASIFVGMGTRIGRGCTSGHGICGLPRFSSRSWVAVPTFMGHSMRRQTSSLVVEHQLFFFERYFSVMT